MSQPSFKKLVYLLTSLIFVAAICLPGAVKVFSPVASGGVSEVVKGGPPPFAPTFAWAEAYFQALRDGYLEKNFGLRGQLIRWYNYLSMSLFSSSFFSSPVVMGQDGWLFLSRDGGRDILGDFASSKAVPAERLQAVREELLSRRAWLAERGIKYLVAIAPNKNTTLAEHLPADFRPKSGSHFDELMACLAEAKELDVLDLRPVVDAAKGKDGQEPFYVTDTHWSIAGSFAGYRAMMVEIKRLAPFARAVGREEFSLESLAGVPGDLSFMLGLEDHLNETRYYLAPLNPPKARIIRLLGENQSEVVERSFFYPRDPRKAAPVKILGEESRYTLSPLLGKVNEPGLPRAVFFHDSFLIDLIPFFAEGFSESFFGMPKQPKINQPRYFDRELIEKFKPEIVIEEYTERYIVPTLGPAPQAKGG